MLAAILQRADNAPSRMLSTLLHSQFGNYDFFLVGFSIPILAFVLFN